MAKKLHNSFIEFLIVIGFDQETGLITSESISDDVCYKNDKTLFEYLEL